MAEIALGAGYWQRSVRGRGSVAAGEGGLRLANDGAQNAHYTNAQIDDYQGRPRAAFPWRPPLTLAVRACFSHPAARADQDAAAPALRGTAGFGFWNDPFLMTEPRLPALPRALWFFYASPPSDMRLDLRTPGWGWKAAAIDAARWPARLLLPLSPLVLLLMNVPRVYQGAWPLAQRVLHVCEARVETSMAEWHTYAIEWQANGARFSVDGQTIMACTMAPRGPLGLVLWIDNQYMVATPWGRFAHGLLDVPHTQWLDLETVRISQGGGMADA